MVSVCMYVIKVAIKSHMMLSASIIERLAIKSRNFNILLATSPTVAQGIVTELHQRWPKRLEWFLIRHQRFDLLDQLPVTFQQRDLFVALETGTQAAIEYVQRYGLALPAPSFDLVAGTGEISVLEWLYQQGQRPTEVAITQAAHHGHLSNIRWLEQLGVPTTPDAALAAAQSGHLDILEYLFQRGPVTDERLAVAAAEHSHLPVLQWLYNHGVKFNSMVYTHAVASGRTDIIEYLKSLPGDSDGRIEEGGLTGMNLDEQEVILKVEPEVIIYAARYGNLDVVRQYHDPLYQTYALKAAVVNGHLDVVVELLNRGAPIHGLLSLAAEHGHQDIVVELLNRETDPNYTTAIITAIRAGHSDLVRMMLDYTTVDSGMLSAAVRYGQRELEELFLERGAVIDAEDLESYVMVGRVVGQLANLDSDHLTDLLPTAVKFGQLSMMKHLIGLGAKATPDLYIVAATNGQRYIIEWLIDHQVPIESVELNKAINGAIRYGYSSIVERLRSIAPTWKLKLKFVIRHLEMAYLVSQKQLKRLLGDSIQAGYLSLVEYVVNRRGRVNGFDVDEAVLSNRLAILAYLYSQTTQRCSRGAYLLAKQFDYEPVVKFLQQAGFDRQVGAWFDYEEYDRTASMDEISTDKLYITHVKCVGDHMFYTYDQME